MRAMIAGVCGLFGALMAATPAAATVYFTQTQLATGTTLDFNGAFSDATPYPGHVEQKNYRVTVVGGTIAEIAWTFDREEAALWWERFRPDPIMSNGEEYNAPSLCDVATGGSCDSGGYGTLSLAANIGRVTQTASPQGFDDCAAVLPGLISANFVGVSANCAESYTALHGFDVFVDADAGPVTLTVSSVPEPASWALLTAGFGLAGAALRRFRPQAPPAAP